MNPHEKVIGIQRVISMVERKKASLDDFVEHVSVYVPEIKKSKEYQDLLDAFDADDSYLKKVYSTYHNKPVESKEHKK